MKKKKRKLIIELLSLLEIVIFMALVVLLFIAYLRRGEDVPHDRVIISDESCYVE